MCAGVTNDLQENAGATSEDRRRSQIKKLHEIEERHERQTAKLRGYIASASAAAQVDDVRIAIGGACMPQIST